MALVLVVDDDPITRELLRWVLEGAGHEVAEAKDGLEGVRLFRQRPAELVVTDIYMPGKEGFETIRELRRDFPEIGIIAVSGGDAGTSHVLGVAQFLGADHVMKKPIDVARLLEVVENLLKA